MASLLDSKSATELAASLERGEVLHYSVAPLALPQGDELAFLLHQQQGRRGHKGIGYRPATHQATGYVRTGEADQSTRLVDLFTTFSKAVTAWLNRNFPFYREGLKLDTVSYRPHEEATRSSRTTERTNLLHIDAFPDRPTHGDRILRVFANVNPTEPRVWITSDPFVELLRRYGKAAGLPGEFRPSLLARIKEQVRSLILPRGGPRSDYDSFMLRLHNYLKLNTAFQTHCAKTIWHFQPGSVWLAMTDACSHAVLRGRYALEHSYFIARSALVVPEESPIAHLERFCAQPPAPSVALRRAA